MIRAALTLFAFAILILTNDVLAQPTPLAFHHLLNAALEHNLQIKEAAVDLKKSDSELNKARAALLPSLSLESGISREWNSLNQNANQHSNAGIVIEQKLFEGGTLWRNWNLRKIEHEKSLLLNKQAVENLSLKLLKAYMNYSRLERRSKTLERKLGLLESQFKIVASQFRQGLKTRRDYQRLESELERLRLNILENTDTLQIAEKTILAIIGPKAHTTFQEKNNSGDDSDTDTDTDTDTDDENLRLQSISPQSILDSLSKLTSAAKKPSKLTSAAQQADMRSQASKHAQPRNQSSQASKHAQPKNQSSQASKHAQPRNQSSPEAEIETLEIKILSLSLEQAKILLNESQWSLWPKAKISTRFGYGADSFLGPASKRWSEQDKFNANIRLDLTWTLWNWGANYSALAHQRIETDYKNQQKQHAVFELKMNFETIQNKITRQKQVITVQEKLKNLERQTYLDIEREYREGKATYLDLINSLDRSVQSELDFENEVYEHFSTISELHSMKGTLYENIKNL